MIEIKITGDTANDIMNDLFVLAAAWAQESQEATGAPAEGEGVKLPTETPPSPQEPTPAKSEPPAMELKPENPMVAAFAKKDGSNVKQCIRPEDFDDIKQACAAFLQKDKATNGPKLKAFLADHGTRKLSELDEKFLPDLRKLLSGEAGGSDA